MSNPPIPIRAVDFVMYHAGNPVALREWYRELFGLSPGGEWADTWSELATEPVTLCINGPGQDAGPEWDWAGAPAIAFAVADIQAAAEACRERGVRILLGPVESPVCWTMFIEDPEGNRLILHQRKDGTAG